MIRICITLRKVICFCTFIIIIDCFLEASGKLLLHFVGNIFLLKSCLSNISNKLAQDNELKFFISLNVSLAQVYFFFLPWFVHINIRLILRISIILINCLKNNFEQLKLIYKYIKSLDMFTFFLPGSKPFTSSYTSSCVRVITIRCEVIKSFLYIIRFGMRVTPPSPFSLSVLSLRCH